MGKIKISSVFAALAATTLGVLAAADVAPAYGRQAKSRGECRNIVMADPRYMRRPGGGCDRICGGAIRRCMAGEPW
jgi:hypothetical protein